MRLVRTIEVKVIETQLLESLVELSLDSVGLVRGVPELGCDEELFTGDDGRDDFLEGTTDLFLILINAGEVEVTVTISDSDLDLGSGIRGDWR